MNNMNTHNVADTNINSSDPSTPREASSGNGFYIAIHIIALLMGFIAPLVILAFSKHALTKQHSRTAFNWQMSLALYFLIPLLILFLFPSESQSGTLLLIFLSFLFAASAFMFLLLAYDVINCIRAAIKASQGVIWRYPLSIPFLKVNYEITHSTQPAN